MSKLKVIWETIPNEGELYVDLDDLDLSVEQWNALSDSDKKNIALDIVCESDESIVYGTLKSFELMDDQ